MNATGVCRTCLANTNVTIPIFAQSSSPPIDVMLMAVASLNPLPSDDLPSKICAKCLDVLESAYTFQRQVIRIDYALRQGKTTPKMEPTQVNVNKAEDISDLESNDLNYEIMILDDSDENLDVNVKKSDSDTAVFEHIEIVNNFARNMPKKSENIKQPVDDNIYAKRYRSSLNGSKDDRIEDGEGLPSNPPKKQKADGVENKFEVKTVELNESIEILEDFNPEPLKIDECALDKDDKDYEPYVRTRHSQYSMSATPGGSKIGEEGKQKGKIKLLSCNLCDFTTFFDNNVKRHMEGHLMERPYPCDKCNRSFARKYAYAQHRRKCRGKKAIYCSGCKRTFNSDEECEQHKCRSKKSRVITLDEFSNPTEMKKYYNVSYVDQNGAISNDEIDEQYEQKEEKQEDQSQEVIVEEIIVGQYSCPVCSKEFSSMPEMEAHANIDHDDYQILKCLQCDSMFTSVHAFKRHMKSHALEPEKEVKPTETTTPATVVRRHECRTCKRKFLTAQALASHEKVHINDNFSCDKCAMRFTLKKDLQEHMKMHSLESGKEVVCEECGGVFHSKGVLDVHMRRHRGDKPFLCQFCDKGFPSSSELRLHEKYHTGEKAHSCNICGRGFIRAYSLNVHMRTHTGEKPYQCEDCNAAFAQSSDLKKHIRIHTGERFVCDLCPAFFTRRHILMHHKRKDHGMNIVNNIRRVNDIYTRHTDDLQPAKLQNMVKTEDFTEC